MALRIGILCPSNIAFRRFLPALRKCPAFSFAGVAVARPDEWAGGRPDPSFLAGERHRASQFVELYGGRIFEGYASLIDSSDIDAVYVPLPPALHYLWGRRVLFAGRHLLMEKPCTTSPEHTKELIALAGERSLALHENYMFRWHAQQSRIRALLASGELGDVRLYRLSFGFPLRQASDFRYKKVLGGGALLDCGGYPVRLALDLLGRSARVVQARLVQPDSFEVDMYGSAVLENDKGECAQISFGMDNAYQCSLEIWGSRATLIAPRVFTAGADVRAPMTIRTSTEEHQVVLEEDDQFLHSLERFHRSVTDRAAREEIYADIEQQALAIEELRRRGSRA